MNINEIPRQRLFSQRLAGTPPGSGNELLNWIGAMQAQEYTGGKWSLGIRLPGTSDAGVERAIEDRSVVRTWAYRGTLHFVAPECVRWMLALIQEKLRAKAKKVHESGGIDEALVSRVKALFEEALRDGARLNRPEIFDLLERNGIPANDQRGYHLLWRCAIDGLICQGPVDGKQPTFVLLDDWIPARSTIDRQEALATLARMYFTSHGPVALSDFVAWSGLTVGDAKAGLAAAADSLREIANDGRSFWMSRENDGDAGDEPIVHFLAGFDELVLGYRDRTVFIDTPYLNRIAPGGNGVFHPTLTIDGRVAGLWKRKDSKKVSTIELRPFRTFTSTEIDAVEAAAWRYGRFVDRDVELKTLDTE